MEPSSTTSKSNSGKKNFREYFSSIAEIIGFAVDLRELTTIIFGLLGTASLLFARGEDGTTGTFIFTNIRVTPFHAFGLWLISTYTFLGFARADWERNRIAKSYRENFHSFILFDLLLGWRHTLYSVIAVAFAFLLAWNVIEMFIFWPSLWEVVTITVLIGVFVVPFGFLIFSDINPEKDRLAARFLKQVDEDWNRWDKLIQQRISDKQWISTHNFEDVKTIHKVDDEQISVMLAKYANKHPRLAHFGEIYSRESSKTVSYGKALINLKHIMREKYYFS